MPPTPGISIGFTTGVSSKAGGSDSRAWRNWSAAEAESWQRQQLGGDRGTRGQPSPVLPGGWRDRLEGDRSTRGTSGFAAAREAVDPENERAFLVEGLDPEVSLGGEDERNDRNGASNLLAEDDASPMVGADGGHDSQRLQELRNRSRGQ